MVRAAGRSLSPAVQGKPARQAGHGCALQSLVGAHAWQQAGKALGQHRLARAWRSNHQKTVPTGCRNFKHPLGAGLPFDVSQIWVGGLQCWLSGRHPAPARCRLRGGCIKGLGQKLPHHIEQMAGAVDLGLRHQGRLLGAARRQHQPCEHLPGMQRQAHGQRTAHRAQVARQRKLASKLVAGEPRRVDLAAGRQNTQSDRQIKATRVFGQIGWRQVHRDALVVGKLQPRVLNGAAHPLAGLFDLDIGQPHQREARQAIGQMHFDRHGGGIQPEQGPALHQSKTHGVPL